MRLGRECGGIRVARLAICLPLDASCRGSIHSQDLGSFAAACVRPHWILTCAELEQVPKGSPESPRKPVAVTILFMRSGKPVCTKHCFRNGEKGPSLPCPTASANQQIFRASRERIRSYRFKAIFEPTARCPVRWASSSRHTQTLGQGIASPSDVNRHSNTALSMQVG